MRVLPLLGVLLLAGCAAPPPAWVKPGVSEAEAAKIGADCEFQAESVTQQADPTLRSGLAAGIDRRMRRNDLLAMCMRNKGFARAP